MPLDIGVGILLSLGIAEWFDVPVTPLLVCFGIAAALLPDIDIVTALFGQWKHRTATHFPITYIPLSLGVFFLLGPVYGTLFTLGVYAHLVHDTFGIGWGIAWLWPFSRRKFLLFPEHDRRAALGIVATWTPEQEESLKASDAGSSWVREFYLRPNPIAYIEYGVLLLALCILFLYVY